jgi:hypothetical protein
LPHGILQVFNTILYKNEFQNPQIFQQTISLFPEQSTLVRSVIREITQKRIVLKQYFSYLKYNVHQSLVALNKLIAADLFNLPGPFRKSFGLQGEAIQAKKGPF